jgi:hypothetical protein
MIDAYNIFAVLSVGRLLVLVTVMNLWHQNGVAIVKS